MEAIHIVVLQCLFVILAFRNFGILVGICCGILVVVFVVICVKKINKLFVILPILMILNLVFNIDYHKYSKNDNVKILINIIESHGKIIKINNKIPSVISYATVDFLPDGKYSIEGIITKKDIKYNKNYYKIKANKQKLINKNIIKKYFDEKIEKICSNKSLTFKNMYYAVILGETSRIDKDTRDLFAYSGTSHLLALSGMHVGFIYIIFLFIISKFRLLRKNLYLLVLVAISLYYLGVNKSLSLNRAYIMIVISICGKLCYENVDMVKSLFVSLLIGMFLNPLSIEETSLQLSYLAVFAISAIYPFVKKIYKSKYKIVNWLILCFIIQIFLLPVQIKTFGVLPIFALFSNLIIMPIGSIYISSAFVGLLLENLNLGFIISPIIELSYYIFNKILEFCYKIPLLTINIDVKISNLFIFIFYFIVIGIILYIRDRELKNYENN